MGAVSEQARTESVRVKLAPQMTVKLEEMAIEYGMPTSTLAAFAISQWIIEQDRKLKFTKMAVMDASKRMADSFSGEGLEKAMEKALPAVVLALAEAGHLEEAKRLESSVDRVEASASK